MGDNGRLAAAMATARPGKRRRSFIRTGIGTPPTAGGKPPGAGASKFPGATCCWTHTPWDSNRRLRPFAAPDYRSGVVVRDVSGRQRHGRSDRRRRRFCRGSIRHGWTESLNSQIAGAIQASNAGGVDAFVAKLTPAGSGLVYATYIGGRGDGPGPGHRVDGAGQAYVTGSTASTNFPLAAPIQSTLGGGRDAFALKLNALGNMLVYSTYLGGVNTDTGNAIAVDSSGNAYIAGDTLSANFPVRDAEQSALAGSQNAFVTKLTSAGGVVFSTLLGGSTVDHAGGIALDSSHNVYVAGGTLPPLPGVGAIQAVNGGYQDAFLTKLNSAGSRLSTARTWAGAVANGNSRAANAVAGMPAAAPISPAPPTPSIFPSPRGRSTSYNAVEAAFAAKVNPPAMRWFTAPTWAAPASTGRMGWRLRPRSAYVAAILLRSIFPLPPRCRRR